MIGIVFCEHAIIKFQQFSIRYRQLPMLTDMVAVDIMDEVASYVEEKSRYEPTVSQLLLIQQQTDLMMEISRAQKLPKSNRLSAEISQMSFDLSEGVLNRSINMSFSCIDLKKDLSVTKDEEGRTLGEALAEVRKQCSRKTYELVKEKIGCRDAFRKQKKMQKEKQFNDQLSKRCLKLTEQVAQYESKIKALEEKLQGMTDSKKKMATSQMAAFSKEEYLIKMEKSILYKQKMLAGARRKLTTQTQLLEEQRKNNENLKTELENLLIALDEKELMGSCKGKCWQSDIFDKCKENLNMQRHLLERQEEQIEKHYLEVKEIADKMKREMR